MIAALEFLDYDFMRRAMIAALLVGFAAPAVGIFLVQRRLALSGDGLGHVAVTGVVLDRAPVAVAPITAVVGAVVLELMRAHRTEIADIALAMLFYGGIAGGVVLVSRAPAGGRSLNQYLFGSITTTTNMDLIAFAVLAGVVVVVTAVVGPALFAVGDDEEFAAVNGLPVLALNLTLAVFAAFTVVIAMRVVGVLLVSALMVVPVATAQLLARSFRSTYLLGIALGAGSAFAGVVASYYGDTPSGATIVLVAVGLFAITLLGGGARGLVGRIGR